MKNIDAMVARVRKNSATWAQDRDAELTEMEENCFSEYYPRFRCKPEGKMK